MTDKAKKAMTRLLPAPKFCGRGIRCKVLTPKEKDAARERAALESAQPKGQEVTSADERRFQTASLRECLVVYVDAVTKTSGMTKRAELDALPESDWEPCDSERYAEYFGGDNEALSDEMIASLYLRDNVVTKDEVDAIVGESLKASSV